MNNLLQSYVTSAYNNHPISSLGERLTTIAPNASATQRIQLAMLPILLPELEQAIRKLIIDAKDDVKLRGFAGGLLSYVYNPLDFLAEDDSPIGLIDDTFICALGLLKLMDTYPPSKDELTWAACNLVASLLSAVDNSLREAIESFVSGLEQTTSRQINLGVFDTGVAGANG